MPKARNSAQSPIKETSQDLAPCPNAQLIQDNHYNDSPPMNLFEVSMPFKWLVAGSCSDLTLTPAFAQVIFDSSPTVIPCPYERTGDHADS